MDAAGRTFTQAWNAEKDAATTWTTPRTRKCPACGPCWPRRGGTFENSFVSYPICRPSRSTTVIGPLLPKPPRNGPSWAEQCPARRARGAAYNAAVFVESAVYVDGRRTTTGTPEEACP